MAFSLTLDGIFGFLLQFLVAFIAVAIVLIPLFLLGFWISGQNIKRKALKEMDEIKKKELEGGLNGIQKTSNGGENSSTESRRSSTGNEGVTSSRNLSQYRSGEAETRKYLSSTNKSNYTPAGNVGKIKLH